ncbi:MAG: MBL fold metallo-hydrolase [Clostridia bacterium]|nr:MBL fold metallo-hydrolase [Clostridia bacterium]
MKKNLKKFKNPLSLIIIVIITIALFVSEAGCLFQDRTDSQLKIPDGSMTVSFVDVGQGDCIFARLPNNEIMLVDCGEYSERDAVCDFLDRENVKKIDYLVATHPHVDHMGGMSHIIKKYDIGSFFMPDTESDTNAFIYMLEALDEKNIQSNIVRAGDMIFESDSFRCEVISPVLDSYEETNDFSVVLRLTCGEKSFLLTGDAETYAEKHIKSDVSADVLKVGHHGSITSTSEEFLEKVNPKYAVISCGKDNSYGHPHKEIIDILNKYNIQVYRTDISGTITFFCDGKTVEVID